MVLCISCAHPHRLSYEELSKEVDHWKQQISECKKQLEESEEVPKDLGEQMNAFIPVIEDYCVEDTLHIIFGSEPD